jgi:SAM-dependent methyltransferase
VPTLDPDAEWSVRHEAHRARSAAESFGRDAERYHRARPSYPEEMVERIATESPGPNVLDVGIGTGIAARQFRGAGCRVFGVDVDPRMADLARQDGFEVEVARFEEWEPAGRIFDAVTAGQAWHWVDPALGAAKAAEILRPHGRLAVFWNVFQPPSEVAASFAAVYGRVLPDQLGRAWTRPVLQSYEGLFTKASDGIVSVDGFGDPEQWRFDWQRVYTRDEWLDQVPTFGGASQMPAEVMGELLAGIRTALDALGGTFTMDYTTVVVTALRTGGT